VSSSTTFDEPHEFDVDDGVARTADQLVAVRFGNGRVEHVHPNSLRLNRAGD
jgi:hypothetical protein